MARLIVHATARAGNEPNLLVRHEISPSLCFPDAARNDLERAGHRTSGSNHLQQFPVDLNQDGFRGPGEALWH
jgi:hypothetical protein